MYEDDPQDTVFDVLGEAVFGGHPLGRPIIGRAPVIRDTPVDVIADFHARRYVPGSVVIAAAGSVDHDADRRAGRAHAARARRAASRRPRRSPRRRTPRADRALPAQGHRAVPRHASAASGCSAATTAASPPACWTRSSAGCPRRGCSRPCARSAGWPTASTRSPASTPTRARSASTSARARTTCVEAMKVVGDELERLREEPGHRGGARARARERQGAGRARAWSPPGARMHRLGGSLLFGLPLLETDEVMERIDAVTLDDMRSLVDELWAPGRAVRRRHRPRRGRVPRAPSRTCAGETLAAMIRVAVAGAAGRMGRDDLRGRRGRARTWS